MKPRVLRVLEALGEGPKPTLELIREAKLSKRNYQQVLRQLTKAGLIKTRLERPNGYRGGARQKMRSLTGKGERALELWENLKKTLSWT